MVNLDVSGIDPNLNVLTDFSHLSQVVINIFNNAIDELAKIPEDQRNIWVSTAIKESCAVVYICDSGKGISQEIRDKIFQPFYTTKDIGKGTGLGLSISKSLMVEMGGDLELSADLSQTCFILRLKLV
jgi:C4-dicarboxylate-specific signal transduction histidine kinase